MVTGLVGKAVGWVLRWNGTPKKHTNTLAAYSSNNPKTHGTCIQDRTRYRRQDKHTLKAHVTSNKNKVHTTRQNKIHTTRQNKVQTTRQTHLERVVRREVDVEEKDPASVRAVVRPHDGRLPALTGKKGVGGGGCKLFSDTRMLGFDFFLCVIRSWVRVWWPALRTV